MRSQQVAKLAEREADFIRRIAEGESVAEAAALTGLSDAQAYEHLRNPGVADRVKDLALSRVNALLLPAAVNSLLRLMSDQHDDNPKVIAAQSRAAAVLVLAALRAPVGRPAKTGLQGAKTFEEMTPDELERHLNTLRLTEGQAKAVE